MASKKHPVIKRDETIRSVLLGMLVLGVVAVLLLSDRPLIIGDRAWVMPGDEIPAGKGPANFNRSLDTFGVHIIKARHRPSFAPKTALPAEREQSYELPTTLRFGYSIIETDILGMPFVPRKDFGHVIYMETPTEFIAAPITDDYLKQMKFPADKPLGLLGFPWWNHLWGWLFVIAAIGIGWFELGALRRRREALGMI